ncbi:MAG: hypothetical protein DUD31_02605 [Coriobacteriaceae bacterium]|nr:MAG: hypothetical protein DUD31_02605 [Coriobacteriaceae bacterium]
MASCSYPCSGKALACTEAATRRLESPGRKDLPELLHETVPGHEEGTASLRLLVEQHLGWLVPDEREEG